MALRLIRPWLSQRLNISNFCHCQVATPFWFFRNKLHENTPTGTPPTAASNARGYEKNPDFWPVFRVISKIVQDRAIISIADQCGLTSPYLAELCQPVVHLTGRRHLRSAASSKFDVQRTATAIGRRRFAVSGPETWNSLPAELLLSTLSTATFAQHLKAHLFVSTE